MNPSLLNLDQIPWYLPSLYGDIRLTAQGDSTEIEWENLSPTEREALSTLSKKFGVITLTDEAGKLTIAKPIAKVETALAKAMKRGRKLLSAVVFKNGSIEEIHRTEGDEGKREPYREGKPPPAAIEKVAPKAAVTVAAPMLGCPVPEFERAEVRATRVLREFLTPQQLADFERTQSFLVRGGDTGRQYVLTSRQAPPERLVKVGGRSVFDVAGNYPICVHDWVVPAAEELLELKLFLELPEHEAQVRGLDEAW
jgi:hypothetical protein